MVPTEAVVQKAVESAAAGGSMLQIGLLVVLGLNVLATIVNGVWLRRSYEERIAGQRDEIDNLRHLLQTLSPPWLLESYKAGLEMMRLRYEEMKKEVEKAAARDRGLLVARNAQVEDALRVAEEKLETPDVRDFFEACNSLTEIVGHSHSLSGPGHEHAGPCYYDPD